MIMEAHLVMGLWRKAERKNQEGEKECVVIARV